MDRKNTKTEEFEEAIKNFSKMSLEADALMKSGNVDVHKLMNKSIENRSLAIAHEASKRNKSVEEVKIEFDKGVEEQKKILRGDSAINVSKETETKKSENADDKGNNESSDEESEVGSEDDTDDESGETTEKESSDEEEEDEDTSGNDSDDEETDDEVKDDKVEGDVAEANKKQ